MATDATSTEQQAGGPPEHKYTVHEASSGVYMITDGNYQNLFVTTSDGVVLFDVPTPLLSFVEPAIKEVTDDPVTNLVYTHMHNDHIGGAGKLVTPDMKIYAGSGTADYLRAKQDPARPVPTDVLTQDTTLTIGGRTFEIAPDRFHSVAGDLLISMPKEKVAVAIDILAPDWVPIIDFDMNIFDRILGLDFETFIGGHSGRLSNRHDVEITREYVHDVYDTTKRINAELDTSGLYARDRKDEQRLAKELFTSVWVDAGKEIEERWKDGAMQGPALWAESHCRAMFMYVRFSD